MNLRLSSAAYQAYFMKGLSYIEYSKNMADEINNPVTHDKRQHVPLNIQRAKRIDKTIRLKEELIAVLTHLTSKVFWLVISEHWCGDSAQILPVLNAITKASADRIAMKIVYRDQNPELMQAHHTEGKMAIPKLIQLNSNFEWIGDWGPRPQTAQQLVKKLKAEVSTAATYAEKLHKWYALDKTTEIQDEICKLIAVSFTPEPNSLN